MKALTLLALMMALVSCQSPQPVREVCDTGKAPVARNLAAPEEPAIGNKALAWTPKQTVYGKSFRDYVVISVAFLNGTRHSQLRVLNEAAAQWHVQSGCRVIFREVSKKSKSDIRVIFNSGANQSYIGNDARLLSQKTPTLHLTPDPEGEWLVPIALHEFGHVLGLRHADGLDAVRWDMKLTEHEKFVALRFYPYLK